MHSERAPKIQPDIIASSDMGIDKAPTKVLALAHSVNLAGAQLALASLVKNTSEQLDWTIVCPQDGPFVDEVSPYADIKVAETRYPWWCKGQSYAEPPMEFKSKKLDRLFNSIDYDIALTNTITVPWLSQNASRRNLPHMWYVHEYGDLDHGLQFPLGYDQSVNYISQMSDTVLTVSDSVGAHMLAHGASQDTLRYISQSFDVDDYLQMPLATDPNELLILGSIKQSKGQLDALTAFSRSTLRDTHHLTIAGPVTDKQYSSDINEFIAKNKLRSAVDFIPERVNSVEQIAKASTVLVCSRNEALGRVTLEALASGRVVIGTSGGGTETLLGDSRGLLYDGTVDGLVNKLDALNSLTNTLLPTDMRRRYVADNFSPQNEREDFLAAAKDAYDRHYATPHLHKVGKTGILSALRSHAIIA